MTTVLVRISRNAFKKLNLIKTQFLKQGVKISTNQALDAYIKTREGCKYQLKVGNKVVSYEEI